MIHCRVVTPNGVYKEMDTTILNVVSTDGQLGILPKHIPLVTMLKISEMTTVEEGNRESYAISGGLLYFENDVAMILVDSIENKKDIDLNRAQPALHRAEERLKSKSPDVDTLRAQAALMRALNRVKVSGK